MYLKELDKLVKRIVNDKKRKTRLKNGNTNMVRPRYTQIASFDVGPNATPTD